MVECGDSAVTRKIEERIQYFTTWLEKHRSQRGQVCLAFYERHQKQAWFGTQEARLYWEQWHINISVVDSTPDAASQGSDKARRRLLQSSVEESLGAIVSQVNARRDHLPPVVSGSTVTFPFDISVSGEGNPSFGLEAVKRMLLSSNPPSVLH
ncbi:hypothetical protein H632_c1120p0 [Helicosporidium sp. ATCC 50920]|nr:hypothetical protein H632_c1120p0 [Helicosporidium sp. ATCC 50920]|eukprot:KDD74711.1 hypothetical protein H632_c1120p0 [Helicosporidium sp. ATCC 50920]